MRTNVEFISFDELEPDISWIKWVQINQTWSPLLKEKRGGAKHSPSENDEESTSTKINRTSPNDYNIIH